MTPTIGRIVIVKGIHPAINNGTHEAPAVVTRVWSETAPGRWTVNLRVLMDGNPGAGEWMTSVCLFDDAAAGEEYLAAGVGPRVVAFWPPRVGAPA